MYRNAALVFVSLTVFSVSAYGADETASLNLAAIPTAASLNVAPSVGSVDWSLRPLPISAGRRPSVLPVLYVSFAALQGFDAYSTTAGLARGAREANPMMRGVAGNSAQLWAVKAASTAGSIWLAERQWKTSRVAAIVTMVVVNGIAASVAARNASVLKALR